MTKFCIVAPPNILKGLQAHGMLGIHHLLLAHDIIHITKKDIYAEIFKDRDWDPSELVILDNSVIETGNSVDLEMMADAIQIVQPTCVALPDVLLESQATIDSCLLALEKWPIKLGDDTKYIYIPQGKTILEFIHSASDSVLVSDPRITHWGCPRNLVKSLSSHSRALAIKMLYELNPGRKIHMMGFSDRMQDDLACASFPEVDSIDSAVPLRINMPIDVNMVPQPRGNWWDEAQLTPVTIHNLNQIRMWLNPLRFPQ